MDEFHRVNVATVTAGQGLRSDEGTEAKVIAVDIIGKNILLHLRGKNWNSVETCKDGDTVEVKS